MVDMSLFPPEDMPSQGAGPQVPQVQQGTGGGLAERWREFLADDNNRAALISFGAALSQPMGHNQSIAGHIGQALGSAGQTVTNREAQDIKGAEAESKDFARIGQLDAAARRNEIAGVRAQAQQQDVDSKESLRRTQEGLNQSRSQLLEAQYRKLELEAAMYPLNQEIQQRYMQAKTAREESLGGLASARAEAVPQQLDIQRQNAATRGTVAETGQRNAATSERVAATGERRQAADAVLGTQRLEQQDRHTLMKSEAGRQALYIQDKKAAEKDNTFRAPDKQVKFMPFAEWMKQWQVSPDLPAQGAPAQGGGSQTTPAAALPKDRVVGQTYMINGKPYEWQLGGWKEVQ